MAAIEDDHNKPSSRDDSSDSGSGSDSENDTPATPTVEWLATGRTKRSTAGNRMKSMLANEEPDSDLELLFAEDDNDEGFTDVDDGGSDVQMDSSSDDEDERNQGDDLEGEKELEKQAMEKKAAARKRKAQDAIPAKFRKKVRIDQTAAAPAPRPKKKSERTSWLPSTDMPIRASLRQTTMLSKEQLHQQMKEREAKRLKQLAMMEKKAKKLEALKKPPMTQAERLAEAALVEKRNSKSLNRWEEAEKAREEERLAKLAALNNRTLKGPVVTYWSGLGEWEHNLKHVGRVAEEEKPVRKKREKKEKGDKAKDKDKDEQDTQSKEHGPGAAASSTPVPPSTTTASGLSDSKSSNQPGPSKPTDGGNPQQNSTPKTAPLGPAATAETAPAVKAEDRPRVLAPPPIPPPPTLPPTPPRPDDKPRLMAPPAIPPPPSLTPSPVAPPPIPPPPKPSTPVLAAPVLAPPVLAPPLGGIHLNQHSMLPKSNVLAPPNTSQHQSPLSMPAPPPPTTARPPPPPPPLAPLQPIQSPAPPKPAPAAAAPSTPPPPPPAIESALPEPPPSEVARSAFILRNFDEDLIKDKRAQTQVLFGRRMDRLAKPAPRPVCVITAHPARYRDPTTGLPYFNAYAYREIQRLRRGEYKWSSLLGAWVGSCTYAARGVPERFLKGGSKPKKRDEMETDKNAAASAGEGTEKQALQKNMVASSASPPREGKDQPKAKPNEKMEVPTTSPPPAPQPKYQDQAQAQTEADVQSQAQEPKPAEDEPKSIPPPPPPPPPSIATPAATPVI